MNQKPQSLCFQLPNLPGTLEPVIVALANAKVNIHSIMAYAGHLNLSVDQPEVLREVLHDRGIPFQETTACTGDIPTTTRELAVEIRSLSAQLLDLVSALDHDATRIGDMPRTRREALLRIAGDLSALAALGSSGEA